MWAEVLFTCLSEIHLLFPTAASPPAASACPGCMSYGLGHSGLGFPHLLPHHQATQLTRMPAHAWHTELQLPRWHDTGSPWQLSYSWSPAPCAGGWSSWCVAVWHSWAAGHSLCWWWVSGQQDWFLLLLYHRGQALTARREMPVRKQAVSNLLPYVYCNVDLQMSLPKTPQEWDLSHSYSFPEKHCLCLQTSLYTDAFVETAVRILTRSVNWSSPAEVKLPSALKWGKLGGTSGDHLVQIWLKAEITPKSGLCPVKVGQFPGVDILQPLHKRLKGLFFFFFL